MIDSVGKRSRKDRLRIFRLQPVFRLKAADLTIQVSDTVEM